MPEGFSINGLEKFIIADSQSNTEPIEPPFPNWLKIVALCAIVAMAAMVIYQYSGGSL